MMPLARSLGPLGRGYGAAAAAPLPKLWLAGGLNYSVTAARISKTDNLATENWPTNIDFVSPEEGATEDIVAVGWNGSYFLAYRSEINGYGIGWQCIFKSTDGVTWVQQLGAYGLHSSAAGGVMAWNGSYWLSTGNDPMKIAKSADGNTWSNVGAATMSFVYDVAWNGSYWLSVGSGTNKVHKSTDGITWNPVTFPTTLSTGRAVAWNGSYWLVGGTGTLRRVIYKSVDGVSWTTITLSSTILATTSAYITGFAWDSTHLYWVATIGNNSSHKCMIYSGDGITWELCTNAAEFSTSARKLIWDGEYFVACGQSNTDGYSIAYGADPAVSGWASTCKSTLNACRCVMSNSIPSLYPPR